jgi:hypothetical protein
LFREPLTRRQPSLKGLLLAVGLVGCSSAPHGLDTGLQMVDCQFRQMGHVHVHVSEQRGLASVLTNYTPSTDPGRHAEALRKATESKGSLIAPGTSRYRIEVYLRKDQFGNLPQELLRLNLARDGEGRFEAVSPGEPARTLDIGTCTYAS